MSPSEHWAALPYSSRCRKHLLYSSSESDFVLQTSVVHGMQVVLDRRIVLQTPSRFCDTTHTFKPLPYITVRLEPSVRLMFQYIGYSYEYFCSSQSIAALVTNSQNSLPHGSLVKHPHYWRPRDAPTTGVLSAPLQLYHTIPRISTRPSRVLETIFAVLGNIGPW